MIHTFTESPLGTLLLVKDEEALVGLYQEGQTNYPALSQLGEEVNEVQFEEEIDALNLYFAGKSRTFDIKLNPNGTRFQKDVWNELEKIPSGDTLTYQEVADKMGNPNAIRAVASAIAKNPITIIIPCHRVASKNGDVKYSGGKENKHRLLEIENAAVNFPDSLTGS